MTRSHTHTADPLLIDPQLFRVEGLARRWFRRGFTFSLIGFGLLVATVLAPATLPLALAVDLVARRRLATLRFMFYLYWLLLLHALGTTMGLVLWLAAGGPWARRDGTWLARHFRVQAWWSDLLFSSFARLFSLRVTVEGAEAAELGHGPYLLFSRHVSIADTLLPASFVANRHRIRLRYVLKRELLWNPCLDVFGHRLPNYFVDRQSADGRAEALAVGKLGENLGPRDAVLIFPEGTLFTPAKRARRLARLAGRDDPEALARAEALVHTLPPKVGGVLQLLDSAEGADVVFLAHVGFEPVQRLKNLINGRLIGAKLRLRFRRVSRRDIPSDPASRTRWLQENWLELDRWIGEAS